MYVDEGQDDEQSYLRDDVRLIVEQQDEALVITYAELDAKDIYELTILFIDKMAKITHQTYNQVCDDLKEIEESE